MFMNSRQHITYMVFIKKGRGIGLLVGPLFQHEVEEVKSTIFHNSKTVKVVEELAFYSMYRKRYLDHIKVNWHDKIFCYLYSNFSWIGVSQSTPDKKGFYGTWFNIIKKENSLQVNFYIDANKFLIARMLYDLKKLLPIPILEGKYYYTVDDTVYFGNKALQRYFADKVIENHCQN